jgi:hypothetical protein
MKREHPAWQDSHFKANFLCGLKCKLLLACTWELVWKIVHWRVLCHQKGHCPFNFECQTCAPPSRTLMLMGRGRGTHAYLWHSPHISRAFPIETWGLHKCYLQDCMLEGTREHPACAVALGGLHRATFQPSDTLLQALRKELSQLRATCPIVTFLLLPGKPTCSLVVKETLTVWWHLDTWPVLKSPSQDSFLKSCKAFCSGPTLGACCLVSLLSSACGNGFK